MEGIYSTTINQSTLDESAFADKPMEEIIDNIGLGYFKRDAGDLYWLGVKKDKQLNDLYKRKNIVSTIGKISEISVAVNKISLMESERVGGKLLCVSHHRQI